MAETEDYERGKADGVREADERWVELLGAAIRLDRGEITTAEFRARTRGETADAD